VRIAGALAAVLCLWGAEASAQRAEPDGGERAAPRTAARPDACVACHTGIEEMHPWYEVSCTGCHGGDGQARKKEQAHVRPAQKPPNDERIVPRDFDPAYLQFLNPSDLRVSAKSCGSCHSAECADLCKSLHGTTAGHLSDGLYENGLTRDKRTRFAIFPTGGGGTTPGRHAYAELPGFPLENDASKRGTLAGHVTDLARKSCMQCHLWSAGTAVRGRLGQDGNYRASGCAACHVTYADDGLSKSDDPTVDHFAPGHPLKHVMVKSPPTQTCTRCHFGDASIGLSFRGLAQLVPGMPAGPEVKGTTKSLLNGVYYANDPRFLTPDVHHERGMHCIDCHTVKDVMGDGNLYGFMEDAVEISCSDCHGTFSEPSRLVTSRGRKLDNLVVEGGLVYLVSKIDGKRHFVPQAAHVVDPDRNEYNERAARAMTPQHARLACYACHSAWNVNFFGFHFDRNESFTQLDLLTGDRTKGRCTTTEKVFATYKHFYVGLDPGGKIAPFLVGFSTMGSVHDEKGRLAIDEQLPVTAAGLSGMTMIHHQTHTTRAESRACVECHRSPATLGLGSPSFTLSRELAAVVDRRGLHVVAIDRQHLDFSAPLASLPLPQAFAVAAKCDDLQGRFETLFVALEKSGVALVDARKPEFPERLAFLDCDDPRDLLVRGTTLYVADGTAGIALFDVKDPRKPRLISREPTAEARGLDLSWPDLYVADGPGGVKIFDVSDPAHPDFVAHVDPNLAPLVKDDACAVKLLFQYSRPDDGAGRRTHARKLAAIASGAQGFQLFDVTERTQARRLFPSPVLALPSTRTASPDQGGGERFLDVRLFSRFDLGSPGGDIPTEENDYAVFAVQSADAVMGPGHLVMMRITDPYRPKVVSNPVLPDGAFRIATAAWYVAPFLQRFALVAGRDAISAVNVSSSDKPQLLGPLFGEGLPVRGVALEEFPLDRMVDESGRQLKDISHPDARYLTRAEIDRILHVPLDDRDLREEPPAPVVTPGPRRK
jgi:LVIVD repeat-containing protein